MRPFYNFMVFRWFCSNIQEDKKSTFCIEICIRKYCLAFTFFASLSVILTCTASTSVLYCFPIVFIVWYFRQRSFMTEQIRGWSSTSMTHLSSGSHHSLTFATAATGKQVAVSSNFSGLPEFHYLGIERATPATPYTSKTLKSIKTERSEVFFHFAKLTICFSVKIKLWEKIWILLLEFTKVCKVKKKLASLVFFA